jgi:hypothetical protein
VGGDSRVGAGVFAGGVVATADVPALQADPQMQPDTPFAQAVLATVDLLRKLSDDDRLKVGAACHGLRISTLEVPRGSQSPHSWEPAGLGGRGSAHARVALRAASKR